MNSNELTDFPPSFDLYEEPSPEFDEQQIKDWVLRELKRFRSTGAGGASLKGISIPYFSFEAMEELQPKVEKIGGKIGYFQIEDSDEHGHVIIDLTTAKG